MRASTWQLKSEFFRFSLLRSGPLVELLYRTAIRALSFLGPANLLSSDSGLFGSILQSVGLQEPPTSAAPRPPLSEGVPSSSFSGQNFVETGPPPVQGPQPATRSRPTRGPLQRGEQEGVELDGVPQISGVKPPVKPFYMGLVGVPGVGFMNTVFSKHPSGEFDPTREAMRGQCDCL